MVLRLATGCGGYGCVAGNWVYCGTGHDHLRAMGFDGTDHNKGEDHWVFCDTRCIGDTGIQDIFIVM